MLKINNAYKVFNEFTPNEKLALDNLSMELDSGDFVTVIGTNGAGKSTLLSSIAGAIFLNSGSIILDNIDITRMKEYKRARYIGRLFQDPMKGTAPNMTITENLGLAYSRGRRKTLSWAIRKEDISYFREILSTLNLGLEDRMDTKVKLLSGGQRQALTLMMATIQIPKLLLLDEHTAALDPITAKKVMDITNKIITENNITTIMITHNVEQALEYGNKTIMLNSGKIVFELSKEEKEKTTPSDLVQKYSNSFKDSISDELLFG